MTNSNFVVEESQKSPDFALPYEEKDDVVKQIPFRNITEVGPAGSINSSVNQMVEWVLLQLNKGKRGETQVISEGVVKQLHSPQMTIDDPLWSELYQSDYVLYGLGWFIQPLRGHTLIHHGGNIDGFSAFVSFMPDQNTGVIVLTNMNGTFATQVVAFDIYERLLGLDRSDWHGKFKGFIKCIQKLPKRKAKKSLTQTASQTPSHPTVWTAMSVSMSTPATACSRSRKAAIV